MNALGGILCWFDTRRDNKTPSADRASPDDKTSTASTGSYAGPRSAQHEPDPPGHQHQLAQERGAEH